MKTTLRLILWFLAGVVLGAGLVLILYCLTMPAQPFVYVAF